MQHHSCLCIKPVVPNYIFWKRAGLSVSESPEYLLKVQTPRSCHTATVSAPCSTWCHIRKGHKNHHSPWWVSTEGINHSSSTGSSGHPAPVAAFSPDRGGFSRWEILTFLLMLQPEGQRAWLASESPQHSFSREVRSILERLRVGLIQFHKCWKSVDSSCWRWQ